MTLLFLEGFDFITQDQLYSGRRWDMASTGAEISSAFARYEGKGLRFNRHFDYLEKNDFAINTYTKMVFGFAMRKDEIGPAYYDPNNPFFMVRGEEITHIKLVLDGSQHIRVLNGNNTLLGTSVNTIIDEQWYYIEFRVTIHNTLGDFEVRVSEEGEEPKNWVSDMNIDTMYGGEQYIRGFRLRGIRSMKRVFYDDLYVDDNDFHGNVKIHTFAPTEDGSHNDFTPVGAENRYECVDEETHNSDIDYVQADEVGQKQTFTFTTGRLETVVGLQVSNVMASTDCGNIKVKNLVVSRNFDYTDPREQRANAAYLYNSNIVQNDPYDGQLWNQSRIEDSEFGLRVSSK